MARTPRLTLDKTTVSPDGYVSNQQTTLAEQTLAPVPLQASPVDAQALPAVVYQQTTAGLVGKVGVNGEHVLLLERLLAENKEQVVRAELELRLHKLLVERKGDKLAQARLPTLTQQLEHLVLKQELLGVMLREASTGGGQ